MRSIKCPSVRSLFPNTPVEASGRVRQCMAPRDELCGGSARRLRCAETNIFTPFCTARPSRTVAALTMSHRGCAGVASVLPPSRDARDMADQASVPHPTAAPRRKKKKTRTKSKTSTSRAVRVIQSQRDEPARRTAATPAASVTSSPICHPPPMPESLSPFDVACASTVPSPASTSAEEAMGDVLVVRDTRGRPYVYTPPSASAVVGSAVSSAERTPRRHKVAGSDAPHAVRAAIQSWLHPVVLQRRLRALLVQHLLLSPTSSSSSPHTPETLIDGIIDAGLDATTLYMAEWCAYAMAVYEQYEHGEDDDVSDVGASAACATRSSSLPHGEKAVWRQVGKWWTAVRRYSILHVVRTGLAEGPSSCASGETTESLPPPWQFLRENDPIGVVSRSWSGLELIRALAVATLLTDPYFRLAAHSRHVCYPCLPSTMLLTWPLTSLHCPVQWLPPEARRDDWTTPGHKASTSTMGSVTALAALRWWARQAAPSKSPLEAQQGARHRQADPAAAAAKDPEVVYVGDQPAFLWLSDVRRNEPRDAAAERGWTYMHNIYHAFDALHVGGGGGEVALTDTHAVPSAGPTTTAKRQRGSGCALVDAWILYLDANIVESTGCFAGLLGEGADGPTVDGQSETGLLWPQRRDAASRLASDPQRAVLVGWGESQHGASALQDWVREASSSPASAGHTTSHQNHEHARQSGGGDGGGAVWLPPSSSSSAMTMTSSSLALWVDDGHVPGEGTGSLAGLVASLAHQTAHQSASLYRLHARTVYNLLTQLVAVPISVSRLAMALRWNVRVDFAPHYDNSCLAFLLDVAANPQVDALHQQERQRRQAREQLAPLRHSHTPTRLAAHLARVVHTIGRDVAQTHTSSPRTRDVEANAVSPSSAVAAFATTAPARFRSQQGRSPAASPLHEVVRGSVGAVPCRLSLPPLVTRLLLFRLVRRADSCAAEAARDGVACRHLHGYALHHVERLRTDDFTPQEVHAYVAGARAAALTGTHTGLPYYIEEEARILCMPASDRVLDRRFRVVVHDWQQTTRPDGGARLAPITIGALAELSLWSVEYPLPVAAEMLAVYLDTFKGKVLLTPPAACSAQSVASSFADWTVHFL